METLEAQLKRWLTADTDPASIPMVELIESTAARA